MRPTMRASPDDQIEGRVLRALQDAVADCFKRLHASALEPRDPREGPTYARALGPWRLRSGRARRRPLVIDHDELGRLWAHFHWLHYDARVRRIASRLVGRLEGTSWLDYSEHDLTEIYEALYEHTSGALPSYEACFPFPKEFDMRARKRPVLVNFFVYSGGPVADDPELLTFLGGEAARGVTFIEMNDVDDGPVQLAILTKEGSLNAHAGSVIIKGIAGEFYPCDPDIFAKTYDVAGADETAEAAGAIDSMGYPDALAACLRGKRIARSGWNGKGQYIVLRQPTGDLTEAFLAMRTASGGLVPWLCSQSDALARDWAIV